MNWVKTAASPNDAAVFFHRSHAAMNLMMPSDQPDTWVQVLVQLVARLCRQYKIPVTRQTVLTHAEVQPTLGVQQRGKWDINWLPGMAAPADPVKVGDILRSRITAAMGAAK